MCVIIVVLSAEREENGLDGGVRAAVKKNVTIKFCCVAREEEKRAPEVCTRAHGGPRPIKAHRCAP